MVKAFLTLGAIGLVLWFTWQCTAAFFPSDEDKAERAANKEKERAVLPVVEVSIHDLVMAFDRNAYEAAEKYDGGGGLFSKPDKLLRVTGIVNVIHADGTIGLDLGSLGYTHTAAVLIDAEHRGGLGLLRKGQSITAECGSVRARSNRSVLASNCRLIGRLPFSAPEPASRRSTTFIPTSTHQSSQEVSGIVEVIDPARAEYPHTMVSLLPDGGGRSMVLVIHPDAETAAGTLARRQRTRFRCVDGWRSVSTESGPAMVLMGCSPDPLQLEPVLPTYVPPVTTRLESEPTATAEFATASRTVEEIVEEFSANPLGARDRYSGRKFRVTGVVKRAVDFDNSGDRSWVEMDLQDLTSKYAVWVQVGHENANLVTPRAVTGSNPVSIEADCYQVSAVGRNVIGIWECQLLAVTTVWENRDPMQRLIDSVPTPMSQR